MRRVLTLLVVSSSSINLANGEIYARQVMLIFVWSFPEKLWQRAGLWGGVTPEVGKMGGGRRE